MKEDFSIKTTTVFYLVFLVITILTFFPFFTTGLGNADDVSNYLVAQKGESAHNAGYLAKMSGRFYYYLIYFVMGIPYLVDNMFVTKLFQLIPILVGVVLFAQILNKIVGSKEMAFLYFLVFMTTVQISGHTSLILTYPLYFTFSFDMLLVSILLLLKYQEGRKKWTLILSAASFALGLLFYETYLGYLLIIFILIAIQVVKEEKNWKRRIVGLFVQFLPFMIVAILYLATYFIFRIYNPSKYDGSTFATSSISFSLFFKSLWSLSYTAFPLTVWETSREIFLNRSDLVGGWRPVVLDIMVNGQVAWMIKAILVSWMGYQILLRTPKIKLHFFLACVGISIVLIFMPQIPLAITSKYTYYVSYGMIGYIPTYYSLFGAVFLAVILFGYLSGLLEKWQVIRKGFIVFLMIGFFICSLLTDFSNYTIAKDVRNANLRFSAMRDFVKSEAFGSIPDGSTIFGKDLYTNLSSSARNLTEQSFNWADYIRIRMGKYHYIYREDKDYQTMILDTVKPLYYIAMKQSLKDEDVLLAIGKMAIPYSSDSLKVRYTDRALVGYYSRYKTFTVSFSLLPSSMDLGGSHVKINHIVEKLEPGPTMQFTIYNTQKGDSSTIFTIEVPGIDLNSIIISNIINPTNLIIYL